MTEVLYTCETCGDGQLYTEDHFTRSFDDGTFLDGDLADIMHSIDELNEQIAGLPGPVSSFTDDPDDPCSAGSSWSAIFAPEDGKPGDDHSWQADAPSTYEECDNCGGQKTIGSTCYCTGAAVRKLRHMGADFGGFFAAAQKAGCDPEKFWFYRDPLLMTRLALRRLAPKPRDGAEALDRIYLRSAPPA